MPTSIILSANCSVIYVFLSAITSFVSGWIILLLVNRPTIRSYNVSIVVPSFSLTKASTMTPASVPQSSSLTIISWTTSTKRRVKYPASAVFNAVSTAPFLAPWVDKKNSEIVTPSLNEDLTGISTYSPLGLKKSPRIPASWVWLPISPRALLNIIMEIGLALSFLTISSNSLEILFLASTQTLITFSYLSCSVINPRLYWLLILSTISWLSFNTCVFISLSLISVMAIEIPDLVE